MRNLLFVGGMHGVGKTSFCKLLSQKYLIPHYAASDLIRKKKEEAFSVSSKVVQQVESNQNFLVAALSELGLDSDIMLDGHFCLLTGERKISRIPESTFREISPSAFLILKGSALEIHHRLLERDGKNYDVQLLQDLQAQEIEYSRELKKALGVPLLELDSPFDITQAYQYMARFMKINGGV